MSEEFDFQRYIPRIEPELVPPSPLALAVESGLRRVVWYAVVLAVVMVASDIAIRHNASKVEALLVEQGVKKEEATRRYWRPSNVTPQKYTSSIMLVGTGAGQWIVPGTNYVCMGGVCKSYARTH